MDTSAWVQIGIALGSTAVGSAVTGAIWYGAVKVWMARREERESNMRGAQPELSERAQQVERRAFQSPVHSPSQALYA